MSKSNELEKKQTTEIAIPSNWGAGQDTRFEDIIIPKILVAQSKTKVVEDEKVKRQTFWHSLNEESLNERGESLEVIIIDSFKLRQHFEVVEKGRDIYVRSEAWAPDMAGEDWNYEENGKHMKQVPTYNYMVVLPKDIKSGAPFPMVVTFKGASFKQAKALNTLIAQLRSWGKSSGDVVFNLFLEEQEKDGNTFYVIKAKQGRETTAIEKEASYKCYQMIKSTTYKVDEKEDEPASTKSVASDSLEV